jgi:hypothetical protein
MRLRTTRRNAPCEGPQVGADLRVEAVRVIEDAVVVAEAVIWISVSAPCQSIGGFVNEVVPTP